MSTQTLPSDKEPPDSPPGSTSPASRWHLTWKKLVGAAVITAAIIAVVANLSQIGSFFGLAAGGQSHAPTVAISTSTAPTLPPGSKVVADGGDPRGCVGDARHVLDQPVVASNGRTVGTLQLLNSVVCSAMWGRFAPAGTQPPGSDITITLQRQTDPQNKQEYHDRLADQPVFTNLLRDNGSCFTVTAVIGTPDAGAINTQTPCSR